MIPIDQAALYNIDESELAAQQMQLVREITELERKMEHINDHCNMDLSMLQTYKEMLHDRRIMLLQLKHRICH